MKEMPICPASMGVLPELKQIQM